jgi:hypothetical protein
VWSLFFFLSLDVVFNQDEELAELKEKLRSASSQLEIAVNDNQEVSKLKQKFERYKDKQIEVRSLLLSLSLAFVFFSHDFILHPIIGLVVLW